MKVTGQCFCGNIQYKATINPDNVFVCHCTDCQQNAGTAFGVVAEVVEDQFFLQKGELKTYVKWADSGKQRALTFCPECGTRIYASDAAKEMGFIGLRYGTIDQRAELTPSRQIWCSSALPWALSDSLDKVAHQK